MRIEHDFLGQMTFDDDVYYGIQTLRGCNASHATGHTYGQDGKILIESLALIKKAAALANCKVGGLDAWRAQAIAAACDEAMAGRLDEQFPVDIVTGGGGISLHMNMNEVLAHRAEELAGRNGIEPNTHVNMGQSTNDVVPTAMLLATYRQLQEVIAAVMILDRQAEIKAQEGAQIVKLGRTCLQDAMPVTFGQMFSAWHSFLQRQMMVLKQCAQECLILPLGATAVGTGTGTLPGYKEAVYALLSESLGIKVQPAENYFDSLQNADIYIRISAALKALAAGVSKMASDLRILSSGPRGGIGEIVLPAILPGSSIMPGKINPTLPELMIQVYFLICGNDTAITLAVERGELELNVWEAVISKSLLESCRLLSQTLPAFANDCVAGISFNEAECRRQAEATTSVASIISAVFGYETGSQIAREAQESGKTIREVVVMRGLLDEKTAYRLLDPMLQTNEMKMAEAIANLRKVVGHKKISE